MASARLDIRLDEEIKAKAPNQALRDAVAFTEAQGFKWVGRQSLKSVRGVSRSIVNERSPR